MRVLQRCQLLLRAAQAAEQSTASSQSGARLLEAALSTRGHGLHPQPEPHPTAACATATSSSGRPMCMTMGFHTFSSSGACGNAGAVGQPSIGRWGLRSGVSQLQSHGSPNAMVSSPQAASGPQPAAIGLLRAARGLFGGPAPTPANPQVHTHDKYKQTYWQPSYE